MHDVVAAVVLHKHHLIICVGAGLIQFVYGSHSRLAADLTSTKIYFRHHFRGLRICISVPVACWSQYGHKLCMYVIRCVLSMVNLRVKIDWWLWVRNLVNHTGLRPVQILRWGGTLYR